MLIVEGSFFAGAFWEYAKRDGVWELRQERRDAQLQAAIVKEITAAEINGDFGIRIQQPLSEKQAARITETIRRTITTRAANIGEGNRN